jgi:hypothetical protein
VGDEETVSAALDVPRPQADEQRATSSSGANAAGQTQNIGQIIIDLDIIGGMTETACERYRDCIVKFAGALAREASRLEEADRAEDVDKPEITTTMVVKANDLIRHPIIDPPSPRIVIIIAQAVAFAAAMLTPIFGSNLHSDWQWTVTVLCGILAVVAQIFAIIAVRRR